MNRYFSTASVRKMQPIIEERVRQLIERIRGYKTVDGEMFNVDHLFTAFANGMLRPFIFFFSGVKLDLSI